MEAREHRGQQQQQPKFEDLFEPTVDEEEEEEEDDEVEEELCPGRPNLKRSSPGSSNSRRASAGAVVSEDFDQGQDLGCSRNGLLEFTYAYT